MRTYISHCNAPQHPNISHCNALQHPNIRHCNVLQRTYIRHIIQYKASCIAGQLARLCEMYCCIWGIRCSLSSNTLQMILMSMMLVRMVMGLRQRSSFLWHLLGPAGRHNATPTLLQRPKNSRGSVAEQSRAKRSKVEQRVAQCESCSAPRRGKLHIKRGNHAAWALSTLRDALLTKTCQKNKPKKGANKLKILEWERVLLET